MLNRKWPVIFKSKQSATGYLGKWLEWLNDPIGYKHRKKPLMLTWIRSDFRKWLRNDEAANYKLLLERV